MIVRWDGRGVATEHTPDEKAYGYLMPARDGEVESGSRSDLWDRVKPDDR